MKIYYIYHSCFVVEDEKNILIFDYYKTPKKSDSKIDILDFVKRKDKQVYIFASHIHYDHFNPEILNWYELNNDIKYIFSSDIKTNLKNLDITFLEENQEKKILDINIKTYGSTDEGVSFWIELKEKVLFYAGDLNWWAWTDDTLEEEKYMKDKFQEIIKDIENNNRRIDITFFPVDPRLEENMYKGGEYFINKLEPKYFVPMHFDKGYTEIEKFRKEYSSIKTKILSIENILEEVNY
ncbi:MAG: MBL fold metallo-hydrolase [Fusobacterium sp.]|nr:MBL fold metallo-hydrolase [Fusobacterium sp.]